MFAIAFPPLDPVVFSVGPLAIRWYALAYLAGFILGWRYCLNLAAANKTGPQPIHYDDYLTWAVIGTVLGGRMGYVLFYQLPYYMDHPLEALQIWHGGMSFHGGMMGVVFAAFLFARKEKLGFFAFTDLLACASPIGLFFGRLANFVNGELFGRTTDVPWAVIFPRGGILPRHPSQIYESLLEGALLFILLFFMARKDWVRAKTGVLSGTFLVGYGVFRFGAEFFREPDAQLGYLYAGATMGQMLCLPMILIGGVILIYAFKRKRVA